MIGRYDYLGLDLRDCTRMHAFRVGVSLSVPLGAFLYVRIGWHDGIVEILHHPLGSVSLNFWTNQHGDVFFSFFLVANFAIYGHSSIQLCFMMSFFCSLATYIFRCRVCRRTRLRLRLLVESCPASGPGACRLSSQIDRTYVVSVTGVVVVSPNCFFLAPSFHVPVTSFRATSPFLARRR